MSGSPEGAEMRKFPTGAALTGVAVLTFGAGTAFADEGNNCSDFCNVGGDTDQGEGTAVGPAQGFHYTIPGFVPGVESVTNVGNSNAGHVDVEGLSDEADGTRSGAWVEQLGVAVGHTTGRFGDCSGLDC
jgi:hypothetical protein